MNKFWTKRELEYFDRGLSNAEITKLTGRTLKAVSDKRHYYNAGDRACINDEDMTPVRVNPYARLSEGEKIARVNKLVDKYGVKLRGKIC